MQEKFKNGDAVKDQKLDRLAQFDEKSREYPISALFQGKAFRSYTWRCNEWLNQGVDGACVGFAVAHELAARPAEVKNLTNDFAKKLYWEAQKIDYWPGGSYDGADPFYEGTSVLAGVKIAQKMGFCKEYRWAFSLPDLIMGLGYNGPAILGIPWFESMYYPDEKGVITVGGEVFGGHAILAKAVNTRKKTITLHNSWGKEWGNDGSCIISWDDLAKLLRIQGEACFLLKRKTKKI